MTLPTPWRIAPPHFTFTFSAILHFHGKVKGKVKVMCGGAIRHSVGTFTRVKPRLQQLTLTNSHIHLLCKPRYPQLSNYYYYDYCLGLWLEPASPRTGFQEVGHIVAESQARRCRCVQEHQYKGVTCDALTHACRCRAMLLASRVPASSPRHSPRS